VRRREVPGGAITLANPVTGETLDLPPLPLPTSCINADEDHCHRWHQAYSFGYHPTARAYKVVHVPCRFDEDWEFNTVQVFTLGKASWRDVAITVPGSTCDLGAGIVNINGTTYWATVAGDILSFDLKNERVKPTWLGVLDGTFLTVVHRMLGFASRDALSTMNTIEVWFRNIAIGGTLSRCYSLQVSPSRNLTGQRPRGQHHLTRPNFHQDSGDILTWGSTCGYGGLYRHKIKHNHGIAGLRGSVEINEKNQGTMVVADIKSCLHTWAFQYVETNESLSIYRLGD
jgi:F-box interacting protein